VTRINLGIPPKELTNKHLIAEHRELKRIPNVVAKGRFNLSSIPQEFSLGKGHVSFFYDKLGHLKERYIELYNECISRGFNVQNYLKSWDCIPQELMNGYTPTEKDIHIIRERIADRLANPIAKQKKMDYRKIFEQMEKQEPVELHKNSRVLIVDSLNTFLRSFTAISHINLSGAHIGGLGGFLKSIGSLIKQLHPTRVILVFDGQGGSTNKRYLYPEYKANRHITKISNWDAFDDQEEESESITAQIVRLIDYLKCLPVDLVVVDKIEADDVIGFLTGKFKDKVFIISTDQDYLQLVKKDVTVFSPVKKIIYNPYQVLTDYGIPPHNFLTHKIIVGDKGDNVPGVRGIAAKTLIKLFPAIATEDRFTIEELIKECEGKDKKYANIYNFRNQLLINKQLMDLENPNIPDSDKLALENIVANPKNNFDPNCFVRLYKEDQLGKTLLNPQLWLNETFAKLIQYKLKDQ